MKKHTNKQIDNEYESVGKKTKKRWGPSDFLQNFIKYFKKTNCF